MSIIFYNHLPEDTKYSTIYQRKHEIITSYNSLFEKQ